MQILLCKTGRFLKEIFLSQVNRLWLTLKATRGLWSSAFGSRYIEASGVSDAQEAVFQPSVIY